MSEIETEAVTKALAHYAPLINSTPVLLSLLYDADMMPEQTTTIQGAVRVAAVCEAYKAGLAESPNHKETP